MMIRAQHAELGVPCVHAALELPQAALVHRTERLDPGHEAHFPRSPAVAGTCGATSPVRRRESPRWSHEG
jgi:hypothetical protein